MLKPKEQKRGSKPKPEKLLLQLRGTKELPKKFVQALNLNLASNLQKRQKKVDVVSPPEATSEEEEASAEQQEQGTKADVEDLPPIAPNKKLGHEGIRIQEPTAA